MKGMVQHAPMGWKGGGKVNGIDNGRRKRKRHQEWRPEITVMILIVEVGEENTKMAIDRGKLELKKVEFASVKMQEEEGRVNVLELLEVRKRLEEV